MNNVDKALILMGAFLVLKTQVIILSELEMITMDKTETKLVYAYDDKGKLTGKRTLDHTDRSPISGRWQIPANMVELKPPKEKDGFDIYFNNGAWEYREIPKEEEPPEPEPYEPPAEEVAEQDVSREDLLEMIATLTDTMAEMQEQIIALQGE